MASIDEIAAQLGNFKKEFEKPEADLAKCYALLGDLKVCCCCFFFLEGLVAAHPRALMLMALLTH